MKRRLIGKSRLSLVHHPRHPHEVMRIGFFGQGVLHQRGGDDTVHPEAAAEHINCVVGNLPFFMACSIVEEIPLQRLLLGCQVDAPHRQGPDRLSPGIVSM